MNSKKNSKIDEKNAYDVINISSFERNEKNMDM